MKTIYSLGELRSITDKSSVELINLTHEHFDEFPLDILDCVNLKELKLSKGGGLIRQRHMNSLPEGIKQLRKLEKLDVIGCSLQDLPKTFWELTRLTYLDLSSNPLERIPAMITGCGKLKSLFLGECELEEFPSGLSLLPKLEELDLSSNFLQGIPSEARTFTHLKKLYLSYNPFLKDSEEETIKNISALSSLEELSVRKVGLSHFPSQWLQMKSIKEVDVSQNGIKLETDFMGAKVMVINEQI